MAMAYSGGFNLDALKVSLFRKQERVEQEVKEAVEKAAELLRDEARANVPVDTHNLESAIDISERRTRSGNHAVDIDVKGVGVDGRDVEEYAMLIHEMYDYYIANGIWRMGDGTAAKVAANPGRHIGSKYMERAIAENKDKAVDIVRQAVNRAIRV